MADDPKQLVAKAISILNDKRVGQNICHLIDVYGFECGEIILEKNARCPEGIESEVKIEKIDMSNLFSFGENSLHIIVANLRPSYAPDSSGKHGDVLVYVKNECVLHNSISDETDEWGSNYGICFYDFTIKKLKLGSWIDHLNVLVKIIDEKKRERDRLAKEKQLKETASVIDLGDYDPNK